MEQSKESATAASSASSNKDAPPAACDPAVVATVMSQLDWRDKTLWAARQFLGGHSVNGFLRATATVQRIKRQRARQTAKVKQEQQRQQQDKPPAGPAASSSAGNNNNEASKAAANAVNADDVSVSSANVNNNNQDNPANPKKRDSLSLTPAQQQQEEEDIKGRVMNARTAKKLKSEMEIGIQFCESLHNLVRQTLVELSGSVADPSTLFPAGTSLPPPIAPSINHTTTSPRNSFSNNAVVAGAMAVAMRAADGTAAPTTTPIASASSLPAVLPNASPIVTSSNTSNRSSLNPQLPFPAMPPATGDMSKLPNLPPGTNIKPSKSGINASSLSGALPLPPGVPSTKQQQQPPPPQSQKQQKRQSSSSTGSNTAAPPAASNAKASTQRKHRKKKLPPSGVTIHVPETDGNGKKLTKKEQVQKTLEVLQYRSLVQGDAVAAKVSSRDLWILARVLQDHPTGASVPPAEFLKLHPTKRAQLFREPVMVVDVEDSSTGNATPTAVPRHAVLPLPRNFSEAAEWCQQLYKKGSRVFAMYPDTTSLYSATVLDSTTWAQENDDIVVVQFDEDVQKCHIPSRFVTPMPVAPSSSVPKNQKGF